MADLGTYTLLTCLLLATWTTAASVVGALRGSRALLLGARKATYALAALSSVAVAALTYALAVSDFGIRYVQHYSGRSMPMFYKLTALWGGQEGSMLFWVWLLALLGAWAVHENHRRLPDLVPWVMATLAGVQVFFYVLLLLVAQPFHTFLVAQPTTGRGLNPLLQNPYMVTHPPALYVGYVGMTVPFAFALAALITGHTDARWVRAARPFALVSWLALGIGLGLGMLWAYEELGWGGYWGWDPVENAGLIPWLTATGLVHSAMAQTERRLFRTWNLVLAVLTFELTIFGTFLTRSGFIDSVHAFARSSIGWYFLGFMAAVLVLCAGLMVHRRAALRSPGRAGTGLSREMLFSVTNCVLLAAAALVMVLTLFPNVSEMFGDKIKITPEAFGRWMIPIGLAVLVLTAVGPFIPWRSAPTRVLRRRFLVPAGGAVAVVAALAVAGVRDPLALTVFGLVALSLLAVAEEVRVRLAHRRATGPAPALGGDDGSRRAPAPGAAALRTRRLASYLIHGGVMLMFLGFAGDRFKSEQTVTLSRGQRVAVGGSARGYTLRFDGLEVGSDAQKQMLTAHLSLYAGDRRVAGLDPAKWVYFGYEDQPTSEVSIRRSLREDLFVALGGHDLERQIGSFKVIINPLVNWIWIGFVLLCAGAVVALVPLLGRGPGGDDSEGEREGEREDVGEAHQEHEAAAAAAAEEEEEGEEEEKEHDKREGTA